MSIIIPCNIDQIKIHSMSFDKEDVSLDFNFITGDRNQIETVCVDLESFIEAIQMKDEGEYVFKGAKSFLEMFDEEIDEEGDLIDDRFFELYIRVLLGMEAIKAKTAVAWITSKREREVAVFRFLNGTL